ncbi:hypothetical protein BJ170DRAFT_683111 [Xylariales sp. AK1849]|nr:hypothetical protein BJ170DRAFT_683111 [Xylariales sp. AK1849]
MRLSGTGTSTHQAERAILTLSAASHKVATPAEASHQVISTASTVRDLLAPYCPQDEGTGSMSSLQTNAQNERLRRDPKGGMAPKPAIVYTARADFHIKFADFSIINTLATKLSLMENVTISKIYWELTDSTYDGLQAGTRKDTAKDAIARARDYAEVFCGMAREGEAKGVHPVTVVESQYYQSNTKPQLHYGQGQRMGLIETKCRELRFEPEDVRLEVKADVTCQVVDA